MTPEQRYLFDTFGYLHIANAMTSEELAAAQEASQRYIDAPPDQLPSGFGVDNRRYLHGFAFDKALERLALHPKTWPVVKELLDDRPRLTSGTLQINAAGDAPLRLHCARDDYHWTTPPYAVRHGRVFADHIVVFPYLDDVNPDDGGVIVVAGSHKSEFDRPKDLFGKESFDDAEELPPGVVNICPRAGDFVIITERLTHGALRWKPTDRIRRILVLRYHLQFKPMGDLPEAVVSRLSPETRELVSRAGYRDIKKIVRQENGPIWSE